MTSVMHDPRPLHASSPTTLRDYRGDIQGLRAIAVLTVVAGHAGVSFLPGGFVGVDVFFVISGYLISMLLFKEVRRTGTLSVGHFYARRARRILPAMTVVSVLTVLGSLIWLSVAQSLDIITDALWAACFAANVRFASVGTDYEARDLATSPLQHFWSLGVEEQFYLGWPLIIIAALATARWCQRRYGGSRRRWRTRMIGWYVVGIGAASFAYGIYFTEVDPVAAYFSTPARCWELAVGGGTALLVPRLAPRIEPAARGLLALSGLAAITWACVSIDSTSGFPGVGAALPVLGTAAVLLAGAASDPGRSDPLALRAISVAPLRVIGDWSYSIYLWHWPLLIIADQQSPEPLTLLETSTAVLATFVLGGFTYKLVETPLRNPFRVTLPRALALYPATAVLVGAVGAAGAVYGHWRVGAYDDNPPITLDEFGVKDESSYRLPKNNTVALVEASVIAARNHVKIPSGLRPGVLDLNDDVPELGDCDYSQDGVRELCPRGDDGGDRTLVVLGDSHARMWIPAFEQIAERAGFTAYYLVKPVCGAADVVDVHPQDWSEPWQECLDFRAWALDQVAELEPDLAVVSSSSPNPVLFDADGERFGRGDPERAELSREGWRSTLDQLEVSADRVVLLRDAPKSPDLPGNCLSEPGHDLGDCLWEPEERAVVDADVTVEVAEELGVDVVDPTKWICWDGTCPAVIGDVVPYRDSSHLSTVYAGDLADDLGRALDEWK